MRPATKHYLFFALLLVSLALLVALVLWHWHQARAEAAEAGAPPAALTPSATNRLLPADPAAVNSFATALAPAAHTV